MKKVLLKPGQNTLKNGGIYAERNTLGNKTGRYVTVKDNEIVPPTRKRGYTWSLDVRTPDNP